MPNPRLVYTYDTDDGDPVELYRQDGTREPYLVYGQTIVPLPSKPLPILALSQAVAAAADLDAIGLLAELHDLVYAAVLNHQARPGRPLAHGADVVSVCTHPLCVQASRVAAILGQLDPTDGPPDLTGAGEPVCALCIEPARYRVVVQSPRTGRALQDLLLCDEHTAVHRRIAEFGAGELLVVPLPMEQPSA